MSEQATGFTSARSPRSPDSDRRLDLFVSWLAATLACVVALLVPLGYFGLELSAMSSVLQTSAASRANQASQIASITPDHWMFQTLRLEHALASTTPGEHSVILDTGSRAVAQRGLLPAWPRLARSANVFAAGESVGRLEVTQSLRGLLLKTGAVALLGIVLATIVFFLLRVLPLRTLNRVFEEQFQTLAEAMPQIVWITQADGSGIYFNRAWMDYTGLTLAQSLGVGWLTPFHPDDRPVARQALKQATVRQGNPSFECRLRRTDGAYRWWLVRGAPLLDAEGNILKWFGTCTDIHDLKESNADLEARVHARTAELNLARDAADRSNQAKSDFLAAMSHEIRTPMNGLLGLLELLGLSQLDSEQQSSLAIAHESGAALLRLIDDILDFSKIEANYLELDLAPSSVKHVVEGSCRLYSQIASSKNLTLQTRVAADISPLLSFDALRVGQILNNFLNNAIKFTEKGTVHISVDLLGRSPGAEQLRFEVRDTGIGISAEAMARLFQPFVQADARTSSRFGGSGLGLVISRRLAELMGGSVEVQSEPGVGTTISFTVAFAPCEAVAGAQGPGSTSQQRLQAFMASRRPAPSVADAEIEGTLLLVVDDHPTNRIVLMRQVVSLGYAAEVASDGVEALEAFRSGRFGAIVTDCNMPRMNGYELAAAIREHERSHGARAIPIIGCTANALPSAVTSCLTAGMDDCLVKPVDLGDISRKLQHWLPLTRDPRMATVPAGLSPQSTGLVPSAVADLLDHLLLHEISGGNAQVQADMLLQFRRVNELDATALRQVAGADDYAKVMEYSHRIKGASRMLGATTLADHCERVEAAGAARNPERLRIAMQDFQRELQRLNDYLDELANPDLLRELPA